MQEVCNLCGRTQNIAQNLHFVAKKKGEMEMYVTSPKIKVAEKREIPYVKDNEQKVLYLLTVGDVLTGITEDIVIPKNKIDLIKNINQGDAVQITLKNERGNFVIHNIAKENK